MVVGAVNDMYPVYWKMGYNQRYLFLDFKGLGDQFLLETIFFVNDLVRLEPLNSIRIITDVRGMNVSMNTHFIVRSLSKERQKYLLKSAMIGVSGVSVPFFKIYKTFTHTKTVLFDNIDEAEKHICT